MENRKQALRNLYKEKRAAIGKQRRKEASKALLSSLLPTLTNVVSFCSISSEISTTLLNEILVQKKQLLLPKISENSLLIYQVNDLSQDLIKHPWGCLEPNPSSCSQRPLETIDYVLVPGIVFDCKYQRIGYGKGHYDRFLQELKQFSISTYTIGLGFKEQLFDKDLPHEEHDVCLDALALF